MDRLRRRMIMERKYFRVTRHARAFRFWIALAIAALAWFGIGEARAGSLGCPIDSSCTQAQAYAYAEQHRLQLVASGNPNFANAVVSPGGTYYELRCASSPCLSETQGRYYHVGCPSGSIWNDVTKQCEGNPCDANAPPLTGGYIAGTGPSPATCAASTCVNSCRFTSDTLPGNFDQRYTVIDGIAFCSVASYTATGQQCTAGPSNPTTTEPPPDADGDGTSDGNDTNPENPGESTSNDGEGDGDPDCGGPEQDPCNNDAGTSGKGNTSTGGGNCDTPPNSNGDAILAQIAYQSWATRCAVDGLHGTVKGDGSGDGNGPGNGSGDQPDWTKGDGPPVPVDNTDYVAEQTRFGIGISPDLLDDENIFGAGACPTVSGSIYGRTFSTGDIPAWCQIIDWARIIILVMGAFTALQILMGRGLV